MKETRRDKKKKKYAKVYQLELNATPIMMSQTPSMKMKIIILRT
jgi:hypothetical protein